jgi:peroxygenase
MADRKEINDPALSTVAPGAPVTSQRPVTEYNLGIPYPQIPRALVAPDAENPSGTPGYNNRGLSVLQQHVSFFDRNKDGIIYPWETFQGFRAIGFNLLRSFFGMVFINGALSYCTQDVSLGCIL